MAYRQARGGGRDSGAMYWRVRRHLVVLALRALNDIHEAGFDVPDEEELERALDVFTWEQLDAHIEIQAPGEPSPGKGSRYSSLTPGAVKRVARDSAAAALDIWDPDWIDERREAGRRGGQRSKRGATWGEDDLVVLELLGGWSVKEQAEVLGQSERTVARMRAVLRDRSTA